MEQNYYIDIKDNKTFFLSQKEYKQLVKLFNVGFNTNPSKNYFQNSDYYTLFFLLKRKITMEIVGFFKIIYNSNQYELYDVCRINPSIKLEPKDAMYHFMHKAIYDFFLLHIKEQKPLVLAIKTENPYYSSARKLYEKIGFTYTDKNMNMTLLNGAFNKDYFVFIY